LRIFVGKMLGTPVLNPQVIPSILETFHVHFFASIFSEMCEADADRITWNSGKHLVDS